MTTCELPTTNANLAGCPPLSGSLDLICQSLCVSRAITNYFQFGRSLVVIWANLGRASCPLLVAAHKSAPAQIQVADVNSSDFGRLICAEFAHCFRVRLGSLPVAPAVANPPSPWPARELINFAPAVIMKGPLNMASSCFLRSPPSRLLSPAKADSIISQANKRRSERSNDDNVLLLPVRPRCRRS